MVEYPRVSFPDYITNTADTVIQTLEKCGPNWGKDQEPLPTHLL